METIVDRGHDWLTVNLWSPDVLVGIAFEERALRRTFGAAYADYAARVPALVPRLPFGRDLQGLLGRDSAVAPSDERGA